MMVKAVFISLLFIITNLVFISPDVFATTNVHQKDCCSSKKSHPQKQTSSCCKNHKQKSKKTTECAHCACHGITSPAYFVTDIDAIEMVCTVMLIHVYNNYIPTHLPIGYYSIWHPPKIV